MCILEPHFFRVYYFSSKQEACQGGALWEESQWNYACYLKTVSQQVVCRIWTYSLRFLTPNIHIHTNFSWLKWLHTKKISIWVVMTGTRSGNSLIRPKNNQSNFIVFFNLSRSQKIWLSVFFYMKGSPFYHIFWILELQLLFLRWAHRCKFKFSDSTYTSNVNIKSAQSALSHYLEYHDELHDNKIVKFYALSW